MLVRQRFFGLGFILLALSWNGSPAAAEPFLFRPTDPCATVVSQMEEIEDYMIAATLWAAGYSLGRGAGPEGALSEDRLEAAARRLMKTCRGMGAQEFVSAAQRAMEQPLPMGQPRSELLLITDGNCFRQLGQMHSDYAVIQVAWVLGYRAGKGLDAERNPLSSEMIEPLRDDLRAACGMKLSSTLTELAESLSVAE